MSAPTAVPLLDLTRLDEALTQDLRAAFERVLKSGHFILGPEVDALEKECAQYIGARHALGVSSGTDALLLALMALDIGAGDEVICPSYTFFATAGTIWRTGAKPVFVDCDPVTFNANPSEIAKKIGAKTKAIMPVHLFGQTAEMDPILDLASSRNIPIIEDAAQAIGSVYKGRQAGTMGKIGCFSFFPSKNLGALGDAGLVTTNDSALYERLKIMRTHGSKPKYYNAIVGGNFRIDALQAALLRPKLARLDGWTAKRQINARLYDELLAPLEQAGHLVRPAVKQERHIYNQYVIRVLGEGERDRLQKALAAKSIGTEVYYPVPMHEQQCFSTLGHVPSDFPESFSAARQTVALPIFPELTELELRTTAAAVAAHFGVSAGK